MTGIPNSATQREFVRQACERYWPTGFELLARLPLQMTPYTVAWDALPPALRLVPLPKWAQDCGVDNALLVPDAAMGDDGRGDWESVDWFGAAYWYLTGYAEQVREHRVGPVHSYAIGLSGWDPRLWEHAWVNRIALFLRRWTARETGKSETELFGPRPVGEIRLTHDVDALEKTLAIRIKQGLFCAFNSARKLLSGDLTGALERLKASCRFFFADDDYFGLPQVLSLERVAGLSSCIYFHARMESVRGVRTTLLDPGYKLSSPKFREAARLAVEAGCTLGLHPSFFSVTDSRRLHDARASLEAVLGHSITFVRQHWLRFEWRKTWIAQAEAGLRTDMTLGFNDRAGFRTGAALCYRPQAELPGDFRTMPMVLMDSHLYDYAQLQPGDRETQIRRWLDEIFVTGGIASVNWHTHVLGRDYGWGQGFDLVIKHTLDRSRPRHAH